MKRDFECIEHTADVQLRVYGRTKEDLFKHALQGMFQYMRPISQGCVEKEGRIFCKELPVSREIEVRSADLISLLVDFLSQALYLSDVHNEAYLDVVIGQLSDSSVQAMLHGVKVTGFGESEIKAVTYHDMKIDQVDGVWQVDVVFDV